MGIGVMVNNQPVRPVFPGQATTMLGNDALAAGADPTKPVSPPTVNLGKPKATR